MKSKYKPTDSELEILQVLWSTGPSSVRDVHKVLSETRDIYYTTTLKTMQVMVEKGLLERDTSQRAHIYDARIAKSEVEKSMIDRLVNSVFSGSTAQLILSAIGHDKPTAEELKAIKSLIEKLDEDEPTK